MSDQNKNTGTLLGAIFLVLFCQLIGEILVRLLSMPVPGPVLGMVVLFLYLCVKRHVPASVEQVGGTLLSHLSLLFIPAGVGVISYADQIQNEAMAIVASVIAGTVATIALIAWLAQRVLPESGVQHD